VRLEITSLGNPEILIEINNAAIPDVNALDATKAQWLVDNSITSWLATLDGRAAGVLVLLSDTCRLESDYYRWFTERYENFLYIDRVIVATWARGRGVAKELYREVERVAGEGGYAIATEVYSNPPNVVSLKFHRTMGYCEVGTQYSTGEGKTVAKLMKYVERTKPRA
jgi:predicted GNAT superfamily acetyltransferase